MQVLKITLVRTPLLLLAMLALAPGLRAQSLGNVGAAFKPQTPPPVAAVAPVNAGPSAAASAAALSPTATDTAGTAGLRVVVINGGGRNVASIDGRLVHVGDTVNGMRVQQISAQGVVLRGEAGAKEQLLLTPAAVKRPALSTRVSNGARP